MTILTTQDALNDAVGSEGLSIQEAANLISSNLYEGTLTSPVELVEPTYGEELVVNGGMENATELVIDDWSVIPSGGESGGSCVQDTSIKHTGNASAKTTVGSAGIIFLVQSFTDLTDSDFAFSAWGYNAGADARGVIWDDPTTPTQYFNADTGEWETYEGNPEDKSFVINDVESTWAEKTLSIPKPDSNTIVIAFYADGVENDIAYFDDVSLKSITYGHNVLFTEVSAVDIGDMADTDLVFQRVIADGEDYFIVDRILATGERKTDFDTFDFSDQGIQTLTAEGTMSGATPTPTEVETALGKTADEVGDGYIAILGQTGTDNAVLVGTRNGEWYGVGLTKLTEAE